ncbi:MAG: GTPase HflX [Alphaproteobacteria bacterium]
MTYPTDDTPPQNVDEGVDAIGISFADERQAVAEARALVIHADIRAHRGERRRTADECLEEAINLSAAINLDIVDAFVVRVEKPRPSTLLGTGKMEELATLIDGEEIEVVIFDGSLTPGQQRNLERALRAKVLDRTALILEIFGERARTKEGKLQVDLAHLNYQRTRLVRSWTHLERQRGGAGFMGGPGETQMEADRRTLEERIGRLKRELKTVTATRTLHRKGRKKVPYPIVALVGYTNAGKSTLFNRITQSDVMAKDMLFATLDPTLRGVTLPSGRQIILSDTVGFISDLPTELVAAFRATLEEVLEADLVLHVRDAASDFFVAEGADVADVLRGLGLTDNDIDAMVEVSNKLDLMSDEAKEAAMNEASRHELQVAVSALDGLGVDELLSLIDARLGMGERDYDVTVPAADGAALAALHQLGDILQQSHLDDGATALTVRLADKGVGQFHKQYPAINLMKLPKKR